MNNMDFINGPTAYVSHRPARRRLQSMPRMSLTRIAVDLNPEMTQLFRGFFNPARRRYFVIPHTAVEQAIK
jgi:hypothetical protein